MPKNETAIGTTVGAAAALVASSALSGILKPSSKKFTEIFDQPQNAKISGSSNSEEDVFRISLDRGPRDELGFRGLGFRIRRGPDKSHFSILAIYDDGPAHGKLQVDDEILEINGKSTKNLSHADGIKLIRSGNNPDKVEMLIKRVHETDVFAVEKILKKRFNQRLGRVEYLLKWRNFDDDDNTWEPLKNLVDCDEIIEEFENGLIAENFVKPEMPLKKPIFYCHQCQTQSTPDAEHIQVCIHIFFFKFNPLWNQMIYYFNERDICRVSSFSSCNGTFS